MLPVLLQHELERNYPGWALESSFLSNYDKFLDSDQLILPAHILLNLSTKPSCKSLIAFGPKELLEASFIMGASDYLKEPWDCNELIIRSRLYQKEFFIFCGKHTLSHDGNILKIDGKETALSPFQHKLASLFMEFINSYIPFSLMEEIFPVHSREFRKSLHVHIYKIRKVLQSSLPECYGSCLFLENKKSIGYKLRIECV